MIEAQLFSTFMISISVLSILTLITIGVLQRKIIRETVDINSESFKM